jgi:methionyl-tRNA formyltransferase
MRVVFIGTGEIGVPTLRWLIGTREHELAGVVTQPDKPVGRKQLVTPPPIKTALVDCDVPVFQPQRIKSDEAVAALRELAPDVIVVMAYGQILPRSVLEIPRVACLNLHASLLPRHRGAAPIQATIIAGDNETGITVMYMDEGVDTGDILLQSRVDIAPDETGGSLHDKLAQVAPDALREALQQLANGTAPRTVQDSALASYAQKLEREDGEIDWSEPAALIERKVRAFDPWPGASTIVNGRKLKIFRSAVDERGPLVFRAADDALTVLEAQLEGGRRMSAEELLRGHPWLAKR